MDKKRLAKELEKNSKLIKSIDDASEQANLDALRKFKLGYAQVSNYTNLEHDVRHYQIEIEKAEKEYRKVKVDLLEHFRRKYGKSLGKDICYIETNEWDDDKIIKNINKIKKEKFFVLNTNIEYDDDVTFPSVEIKLFKKVLTERKVKNKFKKVVLYNDFYMDIYLNKKIEYKVPTFTIKSNHYDLDDNCIGRNEHEYLSLDDMLKFVDFYINNFLERRV